VRALTLYSICYTFIKRFAIDIVSYMFASRNTDPVFSASLAYNWSRFIRRDPSQRVERIGSAIVLHIVFKISLMGNAVFWDVPLCGSCKNRRFGGT
jgi:hypothetical protein